MIISRICICCNDPDNGQSLGRSDFIEIDFNNDSLLSCRLQGGRIVTKLHPNGTEVRIGGLKIPSRNYGFWHGNWCWDSFTTTLPEAIKIFNYLACRVNWHCEESIEEIFTAFNERKEITVEDIERLVREQA